MIVIVMMMSPAFVSFSISGIDQIHEQNAGARSAVGDGEFSRRLDHGLAAIGHLGAEFRSHGLEQRDEDVDEVVVEALARAAAGVGRDALGGEGADLHQQDGERGVDDDVSDGAAVVELADETDVALEALLEGAPFFFLIFAAQSLAGVGVGKILLAQLGLAGEFGVALLKEGGAEAVRELLRSGGGARFEGGQAVAGLRSGRRGREEAGTSTEVRRGSCGAGAQHLERVLALKQGLLFFLRDVEDRHDEVGVDAAELGLLDGLVEEDVDDLGELILRGLADGKVQEFLAEGGVLFGRDARENRENLVVELALEFLGAAASRKREESSTADFAGSVVGIGEVDSAVFSLLSSRRER